MSGSIFEIYGYGSVAVDKAVGANIIEVFLKDRLYGTEGEISETKDLTLESKDSEGIVKSENVNTRKTVPARWAALNQPNRSTSPDVRKNETVLVYRVANNDDYYWDKIFTEFDKRGKETVSYAFKNTDEIIDINVDNCYFFTVSTKDKYIHLHTSINDGEKVGYDLSIHTGESKVTLADTRGNYQELKSLEDDMTIKTNKKINFLTKDLLINATDSIVFKTKLFDVDASSKINLKTTDYALNGSASVLIKTLNLLITSQGGYMTSSGAGMVFNKLIEVPDIKTSSLSTVNTHRHDETQSVTGGPHN